MAFFLPQRWRRQPQYAVAVREYWRNRGLVFLFQGSTFLDLVTRASPTNSGGVTKRGQPEAGIVPYISGTDYLAFTSTDALNILGELTLITRFTADATTGAGRGIVSKATTNGATYTPFDAYVGSADGKISFVRAGATDYRVKKLDTTAITAGRPTTLGVIAPSTIQTAPVAYVDNIAQSIADAGGAYGSAAATANALRLGRRDDGAMQLTGSVEYVALFNKQISVAEYLAIYDAPWGELVQPYRRRMFFGVGAASGITGTLTGTLDAATLAATGTVAIAGAAGVTLEAATSAATGTLAIVGTATPTLDAASLTATGALAISGTASITLDAATLAATGSAGVTGTATVTLEATTLAATGTLAIAGATTQTLADAIAAGTGTLAIAGALTGTLADATLAATGVIGTITTGALAATLADATLAATGTLAIAGTTTQTLADATAAATGTVTLAGAATVTLDAATVVAAGNITISGALAQTLADAALVGTGAAGAVRTGVLAVTLADVTMAARMYPSATGPTGSSGPLHRPTEARRAKQAAERRPPNRR